MKQRHYTVDQIIPKLRAADVELGKGLKVPEVCKKLEIIVQTYYRWRQKYGGMAPEMAKELKAIQRENARPNSFGTPHEFSTPFDYDPQSDKSLILDFRWHEGTDQGLFFDSYTTADPFACCTRIMCTAAIPVYRFPL